MTNRPTPPRYIVSRTMVSAKGERLPAAVPCVVDQLTARMVRVFTDDPRPNVAAAALADDLNISHEAEKRAAR